MTFRFPGSHAAARIGLIASLPLMAAMTPMANAQTVPPATPPATPAPAAPPGQPAPATPSTPNPDTPDVLEEVVVNERSTNLVGVADSATQGTVGAKQIAARPLLRPGEVLEQIPGLIVTQHSGSGKANQYFVRGFNLDHGTDFATYVAGMPVNMPTHAHGQGYTDLNFLIPELVSGISYRKGSYSAQQGDFSSAGSDYIEFANRLSPGTVSTEYGDFGYRRFVLTGSPELRSGAHSALVYGLELSHVDGPWVHGDDYGKVSGVLRFTHGEERTGQFSAMAMAYDGKWNSTDQVAERAIADGDISRFGEIDPTDGGSSHRDSLSAEYLRRGDKTETRANAYAINYKLNLFSNFTYFLDHPETNPAGQQGDQFEQEDRRNIYGFAASHAINGTVGGHTTTNTFGAQVRYDDIPIVALYQTEDKARFATTREDKVKELAAAPYYENRIRWSPTFRSIAGLRYDIYNFDVRSSIDANSGSKNAQILSPKLSLIFGPFKQTEYYFNLGEGFHSNDARGTTITEDPTTHDAVDAVTPLVRSREAEVGVRTAAAKKLQTTFSLWYLHLDSELVFTGDAGTTEPDRPSRRLGFEFANFYTPTPTLTVDADFAYSRARFENDDPVGDRVPEAIEGVASIGATIDEPSGVFGSLRLRYFGPRALIEDNSVRSSSSTLINARAGYRFHGKGAPRAALDVFNLFDSRADDIDYYYTSRLAGEPAEGVNDTHLHPAEKRSFRLTLSYGF